MKKIFAVILSISLIMGLAACAGKAEVPSKKDVQNTKTGVMELKVAIPEKSLDFIRKR